MDLRDGLLVLVRWSHALAAVLLVGGSAVLLLVIGPTIADQADDRERLGKAIAPRFKELVDLTLVVFVLSGGLLTFERLSSGAASSAYVVVLGLKIVLSVLVFRWAYLVRRRGWASGTARALVGSGLLVVLLATVLKSLYESGLRS